MKILFVCENYFPHLGGAEVVFKNLAENYVKKGHQVTILTHHLPNTKKKEFIEGVKVIRVSSLNSRYIFTFSAIFQAIVLAKNHDIIQTTSFNGAPPAWLAAKIMGKPVVITVHEVWTGRWKEITGFSWLKSKFHEFLELLIYLLKYDKYVCVSNSTMNDLFKINIPRNRAVTIYNGLDYNFWKLSQNSKINSLVFKQKLGLQDNYVFFSWGRPGPTKGFEYLIKAFSIIKKESPSAVLLLMLGRVKMHESIRLKLINQIKKEGLINHILVVKSVSNEELKNYILMADCVIIPSTSEGFGYTTVESNTLGTPTIVSNAGSLPEVVSGKYLIFENKNHFDLANQALKAIKEEFNFRKIRKFTWSESVTKYLSVYDSLLKE